MGILARDFSHIYLILMISADGRVFSLIYRTPIAVMENPVYKR